MADDDTATETYAKSVTGPYGIYYKNLMRKLIGSGRPGLLKIGLGTPDEAVTHEFVMDSLVIAGTVNNVVDKSLGLRETEDEFGTLVYAGHD